MYTLAVKRDFVAQHYLVGGDWGPENEKHSHHYQVEVQLLGDRLDRHGYLADIVDLVTHVEALVDYFRDRTLNDLPEFAGLNPSIEHFARILGETLAGRLKADNLKTIRVKVWEADIAWASYQKDL